MNEIGLNIIKDSLVGKLDDVFGLEVFGETVRQGFEYPCFFVSVEGFSQKQLLGDRVLLQYDFCISYFQGRDEARNWNSTALLERLVYSVRYLDVEGGMIRGSALRADASDGELRVWVSYKVYAFNKDLEELASGSVMENLIYEDGVRVEGRQD